MNFKTQIVKTHPNRKRVVFLLRRSVQNAESGQWTELQTLIFNRPSEAKAYEAKWRKKVGPRPTMGSRTDGATMRRGAVRQPRAGVTTALHSEALSPVRQNGPSHTKASSFQSALEPSGLGERDDAVTGRIPARTANQNH